MAEGLDRESIEQRNEALERSNQLLERQVDALSRSADLSNTLLDTLKEELGIQTRRTTGEQNLLDINKKINKEISNQKFGLSNVATVQKQIDKNNKLRQTALGVIDSIERKIANTADEDLKLQGEIAKQFSEQLLQQKNIQKEIEAINKEIENGNTLNADKVQGLEDELLALDNSNDILFASLDTDGKRLAMSKAQVLTLDEVNKGREEEKKILNEIETSLGVIGKATNFISKIPGIGKFAQDAYSATIQQQKALKEAGEDIMDVNESAVFLGKEIGKGARETLTDPFTMAAFAANEIGKALTAVDGRITGFRKELGLSRSAAAGISFDMKVIAEGTADTFITADKLAESFTAMSGQLGFAVDYSGQTLETFTTLNKRLGLSVEQATSLTSLLKLQGNNTEDQLDNLTQQIGAFNTLNGTAFDTKQVLGDIANTSAAIQVSFAGSTDELASSVLEAKKLGLNLSQVDKIAESLLNFESSIENELKAELLLGREINLEKARQLALNNDLEGVAQELADQQVSFFEFSKLNRIQQTAISEAMGMGREEMSAMLLQQQRMTMTNDEISSQLEGQELANFKAMTFQENMNAALEKMRDIFSTIAEGPLGMFVGMMGSLVSNSYILHGLLGAMVPILGVLAAKSLKTAFASVTAAVAELFGENAKFGPAGLAIAGAGVGLMLAGIAKAQSSAQKVQDGIAPAGKGPFTITDAYGATAITAKGDGVAVSPNITRGGESASTRKMEMLLEKLVMKDSNVYMDSDKVGSAFAKSATF